MLLEIQYLVEAMPILLVTIVLPVEPATVEAKQVEKKPQAMTLLKVLALERLGTDPEDLAKAEVREEVQERRREAAEVFPVLRKAARR